MIKCSIGGKVHITGTIEQIAAELEDVLRGARTVFCDAVGEKVGNEILEECIRASKLSENEREKEVDELFEKMQKDDPVGTVFAKARIEEILKTF